MRCMKRGGALEGAASRVREGALKGAFRLCESYCLISKVEYVCSFCSILTR